MNNSNKNKSQNKYEVELVTQIPDYLYAALKNSLFDQCKLMGKSEFRRLLMLTAITQTANFINKNPSCSVQTIVNRFNDLADAVNAQITNKKKKVLYIRFNTKTKKSSTYDDIVSYLEDLGLLKRNYCFSKSGNKKRSFAFCIDKISEFIPGVISLAVQFTHRHQQTIHPSVSKKIRFLKAKFGIKSAATSSSTYPQNEIDYKNENNKRSVFGVVTKNEEISCKASYSKGFEEACRIIAGQFSGIKALKELILDQEKYKYTASSSDFNLFHFERSVAKWKEHFKNSSTSRRVAELYHFAKSAKDKPTRQEQHKVFGMSHAVELHNLHKMHKVEMHPEFQKFINAIFTDNQVSKRMKYC